MSSFEEKAFPWFWFSFGITYPLN